MFDKIKLGAPLEEEIMPQSSGRGVATSKQGSDRRIGGVLISHVWLSEAPSLIHGGVGWVMGGPGILVRSRFYWWCFGLSWHSGDRWLNGCSSLFF